MKYTFTYFTIFSLLLGLSISLFGYMSLTQAAGSIIDSDFTIETNTLNPINNSSKGLSGKESLLHIIENVADFLLVMIPLLAAIALIIAGYFYIFSGGDPSRVSKGKNIVIWNVVAVVVAFCSYGLVRLIASLFT